MGKIIKQTARGLRKDQTESEEMFWIMVRNRQIENKKFLRQYPIAYKWRGKKRFFVADFYCHEAKLIVELDGAVHEKRKDYDKMRDYLLNSMGMKIIRIKNDSLIDDPAGIIEKLKENLSPPLSSKRGERGELFR